MVGGNVCAGEKCSHANELFNSLPYWSPHCFAREHGLMWPPFSDPPPSTFHSIHFHLWTRVIWSDLIAEMYKTSETFDAGGGYATAGWLLRALCLGGLSPAHLRTAAANDNMVLLWIIAIRKDNGADSIAIYRWRRCCGLGNVSGLKWNKRSSLTDSVQRGMAPRCMELRRCIHLECKGSSLWACRLSWRSGANDK